MIFFPAVDIQNGKAVRLHQGKKDDATIFADDPVAMAESWLSRGAEWLHIIDLDGAFNGCRANAELVGKICGLGLPCQVGGGIRSPEDAEFYLNAGAARLIIGTLALEQPELFKKLCAKFPGKIGVSLDAVNGRLKTRGWLHDAHSTIQEVLPFLEEAGSAFIIYTDIDRDGTKSGPNLVALENLLSATSLPVIVAGGIGSLEDVKAVAKLSRFENLSGIISGRAIYDCALDPAQAIKYLKNPVQ